MSSVDIWKGLNCAFGDPQEVKGEAKMVTPISYDTWINDPSAMMLFRLTFECLSFQLIKYNYQLLIKKKKKNGLYLWAIPFDSYTLPS